MNRDEPSSQDRGPSDSSASGSGPRLGGSVFPVSPERPLDLTPPPGFALDGQDRVRYTTGLEGAALIADLLLMTPHLFRATAEGRVRAAALSTLQVTVDVRLSRFRRI